MQGDVTRKVVFAKEAQFTTRIFYEFIYVHSLLSTIDSIQLELIRYFDGTAFLDGFAEESDYFL